MEKLLDYIKQQCGTITKAANLLGVSRTHLSNIANDHYLPGLKLALKIQSWSFGEVSAHELLNLNEDGKKCPDPQSAPAALKS